MIKNQRWWRMGGGVIGVVLLAFAAFNSIRCYLASPVRLSFSGGNVCLLRAQMAQRIAEAVGDHIEVHVYRGGASQDVIEAVNDGRLDLGLVLGGLPTSEFANVRQAAALGVEPLHLLVRRKLLADGADQLDVLRGRRIAFGDPGSNGVRLAEDLLRLTGLRAKSPTDAGDYVAEYLTEAELAARVAAWLEAPPDQRAELDRQLPEAVFLLDALPAESVDQLVRTGEYQLVPLPFATALHLDVHRDHELGGEQLRSDRVEASSIPAYTYGISPAVPATHCETIGLRLLLVANKNVPVAALREALSALNDAAAEHGLPPIDATNAVTEFPVHPGAQAFLRARRPINIGEILGPATDALSVFGAAIAGGFGIWGFVRSMRAVHADFHLKQIDRIERLLQGDECDETAPTLPTELVDYLETRLARVKQAAIEDFVVGRLDGDDALIGILTLVTDTRHLLALRRKQLAESSAPGAVWHDRRAAA